MTTTEAGVTTNSGHMPEEPPSAQDERYFPPSFLAYLKSSFHGYSAELAANYSDYLNREIERGREIARTIGEHTEITGKSVLDVGCGYGGLLMVMKEAGAGTVTGIEVDRERLDWAKNRLAALGYDAELSEFDICRADAVERLGSFDIILAQDVLEHVLDPSATIKHISRMLRPGGVVYVQVGNKFAPDQLAGDHHYRLPGITLLPREQAIEYYCTRMKQPRDSYSVGYWHDEHYYKNTFRRHGVTLERVERFSSLDQVTWHSTAISEMCIQLKQNLWPDLRPELGKRMSRRMRGIAELYVHACGEIVRIATARPELLEVACDAVTGRILAGVLRFVGKNRTSAGSAA